MNTREILSIAGQELAWNAVAFGLAALACILIMRFVFHLGVADVVREVEEEHNTAVGGAFFIVALLTALWLGKIGGSFGNEVNLREQLAWTAIGFVIATFVFVVAFNLVFRGICHRRGERLLPYLRREAIVENNAAMIWFIGSLAVVPYTLAAMITV